MYDELKEEQIIRKVGGRFKRSTLIQKRMVQLSQGARPLINTHAVSYTHLPSPRDRTRSRMPSSA